MKTFKRYAIKVDRGPSLLLTVLGKIVSTDDYMPMTINTPDEYEKVLKVTWFTPDKPTEELQSAILALLAEFADRC